MATRAVSPYARGKLKSKLASRPLGIKEMVETLINLVWHTSIKDSLCQLQSI